MSVSKWFQRFRHCSGLDSFTGKKALRGERTRRRGFPFARSNYVENLQPRLMLTDVLTVSVGEPETLFSFTSARSSYVGRGLSTNATEENGWDFTTTETTNGNVNFQIENTTSDYVLNIGPPLGATLAPGVYLDAAASATSANGSPRLRIYGNGRSNYRSGGFFEVFEIQGGGEDKFSADFTYYDDSNTNWADWLKGSIRINATPMISEGAGAGARMAKITRSGDALEDLVVTLSSSDETELTMPATVMIPAGETSVMVPLTAIDDLWADGARAVTIAASAEGATTGGATLLVGDDDGAAALTLNATNSVVESAGEDVATLTINRNTETTRDLVVRISSNDLSEATVAGSVTIPAGAKSITVPINIIDDSYADGLQRVVIEAQADGLEDGVTTIDVTDDPDEAPAELTVGISAEQVSESAGVDAATVTIRRNTDTTDDLKVLLTSSHNTDLSVIASAIIPAGQESVTVSLDAVDDLFVDGTQTVTVTATADGIISGTDTIDVIDVTVPALEISVAETPSSFSFENLNESYIGNGHQSYSINDDDWFFTIAESVVFSLRHKRYGQPSNNRFWELRLSNSDDSPLSPGVYVDELDAPDNENHSVSLSTLNRTNQQNTGSFEVFHADYSSDGKLDRFEADFTQYGEGDLERRIDGQIRYYATPHLAVTEGGSHTITITRNSEITGDLEVSLASHDLTELSLPESVIIPTGARSVDVIVTAIDDDILDSVQNVVMSASGARHQSGIAMLAVEDDEQALSVVVNKTSISESDGANAATVTVSRISDTTDALTVSLFLDDPTEASIATSAVIPAGQSSITLPLNAIDDAYADGTQTLVLTVMSEGLRSHSTELDVTDDTSDAPAALTATVAANTFSEESGAAATTLTITRNTDTRFDQVVELLSSDPTEVNVVENVIIPAGAASIEVPLNAIDDGFVDGTEIITLTAVAADFVDGVTTVTVTDSNTPSLSLSINRALSRFSFDGARTTWVGRGLTDYSIDEDVWQFRTYGNARHQTISMSLAGSDGVPDSWTIELRAPYGELLTEKYYTNSREADYAFSSQPGLSVSSSGRSNSTNGGFLRS